MTDARQRAHIFASIANGDGISDACEAAEADLLVVIEELLADAPFAGALLIAQHERDRRNWRNLSLDLHSIRSAIDEAASSASYTYSAVEDLGAMLASRPV